MDNKDNSQFSLPEYKSESNIIAFPNSAEQGAFPNTPEKLQAPFQFSKDLEAILDSCRETAEALEQMHGHEVSFKYLPVKLTLAPRSHEAILEEQLNAEREVSMRLFRDKGEHCAHYNGKVQTPYSTPDVGHWYIETMINGKPGTGKVIHLETHKDHIKKFDSFGQRIPVTISDLEVIVPLMKNYVQEVMKELYLFDWDRAQVLLDGIDFPDNISKLIVPEHPAPEQRTVRLPDNVIQFPDRSSERSDQQSYGERAA